MSGDRLKKQKLVVLGLILDERNRFLAAQRLDPKIRDAHLKWDIPGGTNEFGESLEETLAREVNEETGIGITIESLLPLSISRFWEHEDYLQHTLVFCYECKVLSGEPKPNDSKIGALKWMYFSEAQLFDFLPTTKTFLDLYAEFPSLKFKPEAMSPHATEKMTKERKEKFRRRKP